MRRGGPDDDKSDKPDDKPDDEPDDRAPCCYTNAVTFFDTSLRRESTCPVHFVWDGNGVGRPFVRTGFMLALVAGATGTLGVMSHQVAVSSASGAVAIAAALSWGLGQLLTRFVQARARRQAR